MFTQKQADQGYVTANERKIDPVEIEGNTVFLTRHDPYGFIYLSLAKGELPEEYRSAYTSTTVARQAINKYRNERLKALEDIKNEQEKKECKGQGKKATQSKISLLEDTSLKPQA